MIKEGVNMFKKILLPLDGSDVAENTLLYGKELAEKFGSEIVLYHVHSHEHQYQERMFKVYLETTAESIQRRTNTKVEISTNIDAGEATESICNFVNKNNIDLVVMTAVSSAGYKIGKLLGSVTDHICRNVPIPVMLIRPGNIKSTSHNEPLFKQMLVPLDGSELSNLALPVAEELASRLKAKTTLFQMANLIRLYDSGYGVVAYPNYTALNEQEKERVIKDLGAVQESLKRKGLDVTSMVVSGYDAAYEIIEFCKKTDVDLVVMSTHGRTGLGRWVFGNVAEKVLRHGQSHLLLVHAAAG
jgi:nucleotide-binding universal stress UspA family protein